MLQGVTGGYKGLQRVTEGYKRLQGGKRIRIRITLIVNILVRFFRNYLQTISNL